MEPHGLMAHDHILLILVLAGAYRDKFGGDHIDDVRAAVDAYCTRIGWKPRS